jgi:hypothetical protein
VGVQLPASATQALDNDALAENASVPLKKMFDVGLVHPGSAS